MFILLIDHNQFYTNFFNWPLLNAYIVNQSLLIVLVVNWLPLNSMLLTNYR